MSQQQTSTIGSLIIDRSAKNLASSLVVEKLVAGRGKKVTPKDVPAIRFKQYLRKQAEPMYRA